jgi:hypothetical protein
MAQTVLTSSECSWNHVSVRILGRTITGLRGYEVKETIEKEVLYGSGGEPVDILEGNAKYEGNLKLLKYEVDLLNDAAMAAGYSSINRVPHTLIAIDIEYKKGNTTPIRYLSVKGVSFTEAGYAQEQNAKMTEVTLPFIAMGIENSKK